MYNRKIDINPYIVMANHVRMKIKKALLKSFVMSARSKNAKPKNSGTPVKRKKTAVTRSCLISRRKAI
jgi:hypothetical protein